MPTLPLACEPDSIRLRAGSKEKVRVILKSQNGPLPGDARVKVVHGKLEASEPLKSGKLAVEVTPPKRSGHLGVFVTGEKDGKPVRYRVRLPVDTSRLGFVWEMVESLGLALVLVVIIKAFLFQLFFIPSGSMEPTLYKGDRLFATPLPYHLRTPRRGEVIIFRAPQEASPHRNRDEIDLCFMRPGPGAPCPYPVLEIPLPGFFRKSDALDLGPLHVPYPYRMKHRVDDFIKRVIAVEGDTVEVKEGYVWVNGQRQNERVMTPTGPSDGDTDYVLAQPPMYDYIRLDGEEVRGRPVTVPQGHVFVMGDNRNNSRDSHEWGFLPVDRVIAKALFIVLPPGRMGAIP